MIKYTLLSVSTIPSINIGDYVQALAARQFYPHLDGFLERERLDKCEQPCKMIMNGWYMHQPEHWPPTDFIQPLYVAFHLNKLAQDKLLLPQSINYFKTHQPIGCRDMHTVQLLRENGIDAYFSGCLTLTLGRTYHSEEKDGGIYIVDPALELAGKTDMIKELLLGVPRFISVFRVFKNRKVPGKYLSRLAFASKFYRIYSKLFTDDILLRAAWITQESAIYKNDFPTNELRLAEAERLVMKYARAACVITSRIHCALPCLGLQTPVLFVNNTLQNDISSCRFEGLINLFNVVDYNGRKVKYLANQDAKTKISLNNFPKNKEDWRSIADRIASICISFCKD